MSRGATWHRASCAWGRWSACAALVPAVAAPAALGCQGPDVLVGREREAVSWATCSGSDCVTPESTQMTSPHSVKTCDANPVGTLEGAIRLELDDPSCGSPDGCWPDVGAVRVAPDGSVWGLVRISSDEGESMRLQHYSFSADGTPVGASVELEPLKEHTSYRGALDVDAVGNVIVAVDSSYVTDWYYESHVKIHRFDAQLVSLGEPFEVEGIRDPQVVAGEADVFVVAGDKDGANHGVLTRFRGTVPEFVQTALPISGYAGQGVTSVAIHPDGQISVVSTRSRSHGGQGRSEIGAVRLDAEGQLLWDRKLLGDYAGGVSGKGESTLGGNLVVVDAVDGAEEALSVRSISKTGTEDWAYLVQGWDQPVLAVDPTSSRIFVGTARGVAVISADGQHCDPYVLPSEYHGPNVLSVSEPYLYFEDGTGSMARARLPAVNDVR